MKTRAEQRQEELARRKHHYRPAGHRYQHSVITRGCLICGRSAGEHEDEPADQEEPGENVGGGDQSTAGATGGGDAAASGGATGGAAGGGTAGGGGGAGGGA